jgi:hypothetical protein
LIWKNWTQNLGAKILAFVCATALWFSVTNRLEFEKTLVFPIEYVNRPASLSSVDPMPTHVSARVRGRGKFLRYTTLGGVCRVDLVGSQIGTNTLIIDQSNLVLPGDAQVSRAEILDPRRIVVEFDETVVRDIPITPTITGRPDPRYVQVGKTFLNPAEARVKGPRQLVDEIALLATEPVDISGNRSTVRKRVRIPPPAHPTVEITPTSVEVGITIEPLETLRLENVAIVLHGNLKPDWVATSRPSALSVEIAGAKSVVEVVKRDVTSLTLGSDEWSLGTTILRLKEVRGRDLVFAPHESFPLVTAPPWGTDQGNEGPGRPAPDLPASGKVSPAVRGEVIAKLPLPRDVEVRGVEPDRIAVSVHVAGEDAGLARNGKGGTEPAP